MNSFLKKTFVVLASFIMLVAALEILYRLLKIPKITHQNIHAKAQSLMPRINSNTILFIGDSRQEWGIKPIAALDKLKAAGFNGNIVNMAMPGSNGLDVLHYLISKDINPKLILHGYAPNYGGYKNHGFDKEDYTEFKKISETFSYWLDQNFYFRDASVINWLRRIPIYFKTHQYDSLGGAIVTEYGDYISRFNTQQDMYKGFKTNFKQTTLDEYCQQADSAIAVLKRKGTLVCGINMPISKKIYELQNLTNGNVAHITSYNKFYDFSFFTYTNEASSHDSAFFYDGCHLLPEYAAVFTEKVMDSLRKDLPGIK